MGVIWGWKGRENDIIIYYNYQNKRNIWNKKGEDD